MNRVVAALALISVATTASPALAKKDKKAPAVAAGRTPLTPEQAAALMASLPPEPVVPVVPVKPVVSIVQDATSLPNEATLVSLLRAANLTGMLSAPGSFTVFAPSDDAFSRLAPGAVAQLQKPEFAATLNTVLRNHVVAGAMTADQIRARIAAGNGQAVLTTVAGQPLTATLVNGNIKLTDANGNPSYVTEADRQESNGVLHVVNGVLLPKL